MDTSLRIARYLLLCISLTVSVLQPAATQADDTPLEFRDAAEEQRYQDLLAELRCLVCQNQSLADSHADLAQDLREEIYVLLRDGHSKEEVIQYLVARYGDFVRYRPPLTPGTLLLWLGPFLLLTVACVVLFRIARDRQVTAETLSAAEHARVHTLLNDADRH